MFRPLFAKMSLFTEPLGTQEAGSTSAVLDYCLEKGVDQYSWMLWQFRVRRIFGRQGGFI